ncbi:inactive peptidyl-prolyl cis-trans isomerase FKBP6 isoform X1 [Echeneis naucrates]|uniref:peptidylprolyl isomerase n=1 Tax=Echeneis naucrates TaxID=173247 RepID=A0A665W8A4_ECHNA|nr:inactive peptidyl-prolyl cis-trans isomerase FKBP6 isoform X1 [Echeneis naucrates]XP_029352666.1 inactive peptidyl-prolyl cis-trans isomerase FKBP6 isoform X1 [Echeneis naucrates]
MFNNRHRVSTAGEMSGNGFISSLRRFMNAEEPPTSRSSNLFDPLRQQMDDILGNGGILKEVVQPGEGPPVPRDASVLIHYSGFLEYSDRPFETTANLKYPRMMKLGRGQRPPFKALILCKLCPTGLKIIVHTDLTLLGLELGLLTMKKGEFSRFLFQPQYAYGEMGCPPLIPAAAVILYEVQILDFFNSGQVDDFVSLSPVEQSTAPLSSLLEVVNTLRSFGNCCFNQNHYDDAKDRYKQAIRLLVSRESQNGMEKEKIKTALLPLYLNLSLTELRLDSPHKALKYGNKALEIDSANTKALFRCGQAYLELHEYESAQGCLITAQAKRPFDSDINNLLRKVTISYKDSLDKQKDLYSKMFRDWRGPVK